MAFSQEITPEQKQENQEELDREIYRQLTDNETLSEVRESGLLLNEDESEWDLIKSIPRDAWAVVKSPAGWDKREWFIASGVMTMTGLLMVGDEAVAELAQKYRNDLTNDISHVAELFSGRTTTPALAATYLVGTILKNKKLKKAVILTFSSMLISGGIVRVGKWMFGRARPSDTANAWEFHGPSLDHASLPSGHSQTTFAMAATLSTIYKNPLVRVLSWTVATVSALSRIHDNAHWASDVFLGGVIGALTGHLVAKRHMKGIKNGVQVLPAQIILDNGERGFGVGVRIPLDSRRRKRKVPNYVEKH